MYTKIFVFFCFISVKLLKGNLRYNKLFFSYLRNFKYFSICGSDPNNSKNVRNILLIVYCSFARTKMLKLVGISIMYNVLYLQFSYPYFLLRSMSSTDHTFIPNLDPSRLRNLAVDSNRLSIYMFEQTINSPFSIEYRKISQR